MDLFEPQWVVLRWPLGLLTSLERGLLESYLDHNFQIETVRFESAPEGSGVEILGCAQGVVRDAVLAFIAEFVEHPPAQPPHVPVLEELDEDW